MSGRTLTAEGISFLRAELAASEAREARLREAYSLAVRAADIASNGGGHGHWDRTMRHGAGCELCAIQSEARKERDRLLGEARAALAAGGEGGGDE